MSSSGVSLKALDVGKLDFKIVHIDPGEVARAFEEFIKNGSKLTGVSLDDIDTGVISVPANLATIKLVDLLDVGMKLFDAIVWLTAGKPSTHPLQAVTTKTKETLPSLQQISKAVFYCYFFIITQARYPAGPGNKSPPSVANFLSVIMGLDKPQHEYVELLCSFDVVQFDMTWACRINFGSLGQETLSRFGLGVAGYRMFGPFKVYEVIKEIPDNLRNAVAFAQTVAKSPATWDVHPATRNPEILTKRGNLNKNLGNLILDVFTDEQIDEMVKSKMLYDKPKREPNYTNYRKWSPVDDISGASNIFRT